MRQRHAVELLPQVPAVRQMSIHEPNEPVVMAALVEVNEFVHKDLDALARFAGEIAVQPDGW